MSNNTFNSRNMTFDNFNDVNNTFATHLEFSSVGIPMKYWCSNARTSSSTKSTTMNELLSTMEVSFDYEMTMTQSTDYAKSLQLLEWSILWNTVQSMGIDNCRHLNSSQQQLSTSTTMNASTILVYGLSSLRPDGIAETAVCTTAISANNNGLCLPIKGYMQVVYGGAITSNVFEEQKYIGSLVLSHVKQAMMNVPMILVGTVTNVAYVGNRAAITSTTPTSASSQQTTVGVSSTSWLIIAMSGMMIITALVGLLVLKRKRKQRQDKQEITTKDVLNLELQPNNTSPPRGATVWDFDPIITTITTTMENSDNVSPLADHPSSPRSASVHKQRKKKKPSKQQLVQRVSSGSSLDPIHEEDVDFDGVVRNVYQFNSDYYATDDDDDDPMSPTNSSYDGTLAPVKESQFYLV